VTLGACTQGGKTDDEVTVAVCEVASVDCFDRRPRDGGDSTAPQSLAGLRSLAGEVRAIQPYEEDGCRVCRARGGVHPRVRGRRRSAGTVFGTEVAALARKQVETSPLAAERPVLRSAMTARFVSPLRDTSRSGGTALRADHALPNSVYQGLCRRG
jgi:hypothetical protein